jgi:hypothetical protein
MERVLEAVMRDDRRVSLHLHYELGSLFRPPRVIGFYFFLLGFYLRDFIVHSDEVSPRDVKRCIALFILNCILSCIIIIIILFHDYYNLFIDSSVRMSYRTYVAGLITHNSF